MKIVRFYCGCIGFRLDETQREFYEDTIVLCNCKDHGKKESYSFTLFSKKCPEEDEPLTYQEVAELASQLDKGLILGYKFLALKELLK